METLAPLWIYATVLLIAYLENVVPPIPGDMVIVFAGYLVGLGIVGFAPVLVLSSLGGVLGFLTMYFVGWMAGPAVFDTDRARWIPKRGALRARSWLLRHGFAVVAANRFLSGVRSVIALSVGAVRMPLPATALWATVSSTAWCLLIILLGYVLGDQWPIIGEYLRLYGQWVTGVLIGGGVAYLLVKAWLGRRARRTNEDPADGRGEPLQH